MTDPDDQFRRARVAAGVIMVLLVVLLMMYDAASADFSVDTIQLGLLLGTALAMLGVEGFRAFIR